MEIDMIEVTQRDRKVLVYPWAMRAAEEIMEATVFSRMVRDGTDIQVYLAEIITDHANGTA